MTQKVFSKGEAIRFGWKTMNDNLGFFIGMMLILFGVNIVPAVISGALEKSQPLISSLINFGSYLVGVFFAIGAQKIYLDLCDGQPAKLENLGAFPHLFLRYFGASLLCGLATIGGFICLIIPGIILAVKLQFFGYLIIDQNAKAIDSLKRSYAMTKGLWGELFIFAVLLTLINLAGLICLGIGLFATIPTTCLALAYVYRKLAAKTEIPGVAVQIA